MSNYSLHRASGQRASGSGDHSWTEENTRLLLRAAAPDSTPAQLVLDRVEDRVARAAGVLAAAQRWPAAFNLHRLRIAVISYACLLMACSLVGTALHHGSLARLDLVPSGMAVPSYPQPSRYPVLAMPHENVIPPNSGSFSPDRSSAVQPAQAGGAAALGAERRLAPLTPVPAALNGRTHS